MVKELVIASIVFGIGASSGIKYSEEAFEKKESKRLNAEIDKIERQMEKAAVENQRRLFLANKSVSSLSKKLRVQRGREATIAKEVELHVKSNSDCNLSNGAVGLLNDARSTDGGGSVPGPSKFPDAQRSGASPFTQIDEVRNHLECVSAYKKLASRHNALVEWWGAQSNTRVP